MWHGIHQSCIGCCCCWPHRCHCRLGILGQSITFTFSCFGEANLNLGGVLGSLSCRKTALWLRFRKPWCCRALAVLQHPQYTSVSSHTDKYQHVNFQRIPSSWCLCEDASMWNVGLDVGISNASVCSSSRGKPTRVEDLEDKVQDVAAPRSNSTTLKIFSGQKSSAPAVSRSSGGGFINTVNPCAWRKKKFRQNNRYTRFVSRLYL